MLLQDIYFAKLSMRSAIDQYDCYYFIVI